MNTGYYSFPAIHGHQGKNDYYLIQCPLRLVPRFLIFDESEVPAKLRQVHMLNNARVKELTHYLLTQPNNYVLAPLIAAVDCEVGFKPAADHMTEVGQLHIPLTARIVVEDGQHRREAIQRALAEDLSLGDDTVSIMILVDPDLRQSKRLYTDLNQTRVKHNLSQRILHDEDSPLAELTRQLVNEVILFQGLTELEKTTISNRSTALFTLSAIHQATQALLGIKRYEFVDPDQALIARDFWTESGQVISEWSQVIQGKIPTVQLRREYIHAHSVTLLAIGMAGNALITSDPDNWLKRLEKLGEIDWKRENTTLWEGRAMLRGRMSKSRDSILLTASAIKKILGLELTEQEQALEQRLLDSE